MTINTWILFQKSWDLYVKVEHSSDLSMPPSDSFPQHQNSTEQKARFGHWSRRNYTDIKEKPGQVLLQIMSHDFHMPGSPFFSLGLSIHCYKLIATVMSCSASSDVWDTLVI